MVVEMSVKKLASPIFSRSSQPPFNHPVQITPVTRYSSPRDEEIHLFHFKNFK